MRNHVRIPSRAAHWYRRQIVGSQEYGDNMADAHTRIDNLKVDIRELGDSILDLRAAARVHDSKLEKVMEKLTAHNGRLHGHDQRFDVLDARLSGHDQRFDAIDARLSGHDRRFDGVDAKLTEILSRLPQQQV